MELSPVYRYGLPLGSAVILMGCLDAISCLTYIVIDYGGVLTDKLQNGWATETDEIVVFVMILVQLASTLGLLGYGVILRGNRKCMMGWMGITGGFASLYAVLIFVVIGLQGGDIPAVGYLELSYFLLLSSGIAIYTIHLGYRALPHFGLSSCELEPLGKGASYILQYFTSHAKEAAGMGLIMEVMFNTEVVLDRHVATFGFGHALMGFESDMNTAVWTEETLIRYIRIGHCLLGFFITYKEKQYWMFRWCMVYLGVTAASGGIFIYLIFAWRAPHILLTLIYFLITSLSLLFRTGVLYLCMRYTDVFERRGIPM